ncbi:MAG: Plug domain-containing protein, partial [Bacteroidales bacterium]
MARNSGKLSKFLTGCFFLYSGLFVYAQQDSLAHQKLQPVEIVGKENQSVVSPIPVQTLSRTQLNELPAIQLSDALKFLSGLVIKDYGGVGGLKTVSVRGMGAQHTGVAYDGIIVSDCQSGQIDLGKFSLENVQSISLSNGQGSDIFIPAKLFASASLINVVTNEPVFKDSKPINIKFDFIGGSFGLVNPYLLIENRIKKKKKEEDAFLAWSLNMEYLRSKGNYPYTLFYGGDQDSTSREIRQNSDIQSLSAEVNFLAKFGKKAKLTAKFFCYFSDRGLPGATILYNLESSQRLSNQNLFAQIHYKHYFTRKIAYQVNAKFNYDFTKYIDPDYLNKERFLDNRYLQREYYISNAVLYTPFKKWSISLANDLFYNDMDANLLSFSEPSRFSCLTVLATIFNS